METIHSPEPEPDPKKRKMVQRQKLKIVSDFVTGEDGFVVFWPERRLGAFSAEVLRIIADELDRRNAGWAEKLAKGLSNV